MIRYTKYSGCDPENAKVPKIRIRPPVFRTVTDAWHHFIRHPDQFLPVDEDDENLENDGQLYSDDDIFDQMDFLFNSSKAGELASQPEEMTKEGNDDRGSDDEERGGATEGDVPTEA